MLHLGHRWRRVDRFLPRLLGHGLLLDARFGCRRQRRRGLRRRGPGRDHRRHHTVRRRSRRQPVVPGVRHRRRVQDVLRPRYRGLRRIDVDSPGKHRLRGGGLLRLLLGRRRRHHNGAGQLPELVGRHRQLLVRGILGPVGRGSSLGGRLPDARGQQRRRRRALGTGQRGIPRQQLGRNLDGHLRGLRRGNGRIHYSILSSTPGWHLHSTDRRLLWRRWPRHHGNERRNYSVRNRG